MKRKKCSGWYKFIQRNFSSDVLKAHFQCPPDSYYSTARLLYTIRHTTFLKAVTLSTK